jgi:uncharacterized membrane protein YcfT
MSCKDEDKLLLVLSREINVYPNQHQLTFKRALSAFEGAFSSFPFLPLFFLASAAFDVPVTFLVKGGGQFTLSLNRKKITTCS